MPNLQVWCPHNRVMYACDPCIDAMLQAERKRAPAFMLEENAKLRAEVERLTNEIGGLRPMLEEASQDAEHFAKARDAALLQVDVLRKALYDECRAVAWLADRVVPVVDTASAAGVKAERRSPTEPDGARSPKSGVMQS